jgi:hypothetical protein
MNLRKVEAVVITVIVFVILAFLLPRIAGISAR